MNCYNNYEKMKLSHYILLPLLNKNLQKKDEDELEDFDNENDTVAKIKKSKKIIKKLTKEFIKEEGHTINNQNGSQRDKIFYLLLNNIHFLKNDNNNNNFHNNNIYNDNYKVKEKENS